MKLAIICLAGLALFVAGCGGGRNSAEKIAYIAKADRICQTTQTEAAPLIGKLSAAAAGSLTAAQARNLAVLADRLHAMGMLYTARLAQLKQPGGDHDAIEAFLAPSRQIVQSVGQAAAALKAGDVTSARALLGVGQLTAQRANGAARDYGFKQCVSVFPSGG
jgi:hypothetical protein